MRQHLGFAMRVGLACVLMLALTGLPANAGKGGNGGGHGGGGRGQDTTPPGAVMNLIVGETGIATVALTWTASADDGYDLATGPADSYEIRFRASGPFTTENWEVDENHLDQRVWPDPGETVQYTANGLAPESHYWIAVRAVDVAGNLSDITPESQVEVDTAPAPATAWMTEDIDLCASTDAGDLGVIDLEIDPDGNPAILYVKHCPPDNESTQLRWTRSVDGVWSQPTDIVSGSGPLTSWSPRFEDLAFDPATGQPALAHSVGDGELQFYTYDGSGWSGEIVDRRRAGSLSLAYCGGVPTIAYKFGAAVRVAQKAGNHWNTSEFALPRKQNSLNLSLTLVCDGEGNPVVAFGQDRDGDAAAEIVRVAFWQSGSGWQIETVDEVRPDGHVGAISLAKNPPPFLDPSPEADTFTLAYHDPFSANEGIHICDRVGGAWSCADLDMTSAGAILPGISTSRVLAYDTAGTASLMVESDLSTLWLTQRVAGSSEWSSPEYVGYLVGGEAMAVNPWTGELAVALDWGGFEDRFPRTIQYATPLPSP